MRFFRATTSLAFLLGVAAYFGATSSAAADRFTANGATSNGTGIGGEINDARPGSETPAVPTMPGETAATDTRTDKPKDVTPKDVTPKDFTLTLGLGAGVAPDYEGSNDYRAVPIPMFEASWKERVFISNTTLSLAAISTPYLKAGPILTYAFGRSRKDNHALKGLGSVDDSVELGGFIRFTMDHWQVGAKLAQDVADGHDGAIGQIDVAYSLPLGERFTLTFGNALTWASKNYMQSFFGVSSHQAAKSGLSQFNADAGLKNLDFTVTGTYAFSEHWNLNMIAVYSRLLGDAADSPIVKDKGSPNQFMTGVGLSYSF
jgi:outer membrane scaffolding protein for murein synthesis (MipA/OmpV family)